VSGEYTRTFYMFNFQHPQQCGEHPHQEMAWLATALHEASSLQKSIIRSIMGCICWLQSQALTQCVLRGSSTPWWTEIYVGVQHPSKYASVLHFSIKTLRFCALWQTLMLYCNVKLMYRFVPSSGSRCICCAFCSIIYLLVRTRQQNIHTYKW